MPTEITALHLLLSFIVLTITFKVGGGILFWVVSFILGNKLAEMLENDNDSPDRQSPPAHKSQETRPAGPGFSNHPGPSHHE